MWAALWAHVGVFAHSGSSMNKMCNGAMPPACYPGCPPPGGGGVAWCHPSSSLELGSGSTCAWQGNHGPADGGSQLESCLRQQIEVRGERGEAYGYNELVLDPRPWAAMLPASVEAVFFSAEANADQVRQARETYEDFLFSYGLDSTQVPLLVYNPAASLDEPFTVVPPAAPPPHPSAPLSAKALACAEAGLKDVKSAQWCSSRVHMCETRPWLRGQCQRTCLQCM